MFKSLFIWLLLLSGSLPSLQAAFDFTVVDTEDQWNAVLQQAQADDQPIYVFVTADWCGYCKMMKRDVLSLARVSDYYNERFLSVELDGETAFGEAFAAAYGVAGFPTHLFVSPQQNLLHESEGYQDETQFLLAGRMAVDNYELMPRLAAGFEAGTLSDADLLRYLELVAAQDPDRASELGQARLAEADRDDWLTTPYLELAAAHCRDLTDARVQYLLQHRSAVIAAQDEAFFEAFIERVFNYNLEQAIATEQEALVERIVQEVLPSYLADPAGLPEARFTTYKLYHANREAWDAYAHLIEAEGQRRTEELDIYWYTQAFEVLEEYPNEMLLERATTWLDQALGVVDDFETRALYAYTEGMLGDIEAARRQAQRAQALAQNAEQQQAAQEILEMIDQAAAGE